MFLGKVIGRVVSTVKYPGLEGVKLLVVQPMDEHGNPEGGTLVACDAVQAGPGDSVFLVGGREAALALETTFVPVDATIVGHVEQLASPPSPTSSSRSSSGAGS